MKTFVSEIVLTGLNIKYLKLFERKYICKTNVLFGLKCLGYALKCLGSLFSEKGTRRSIALS